MMNTHPAPKQERAWLDRITEYGCIITKNYRIQRHHCVGREGKQNKLYIGRWFVLPLAFELHDVSSNHHMNITHHRKKFIAQHGLESELFEKMCQKLKEDGPLPFGDDVLAAIMDTKR